MKKIIPAILIAVSTLSLYPVAFGEAVSVLLEKGLYQEKTTKNLDAAIEIYEQIVADAQANRSYVARAQYRLAFCHYKKGDKTRAREVFEGLIARFPEQGKLIESAKKNMLKLEPSGGVPVALSFTPAHMTTDVDPGLKTIMVTFDRPMQDKSWSWTGDPGDFPELAGDPSYDATRMTCTLPVKLQPGRTYWVGINSASHGNFKSEDGTRAKRSVILFSTRDDKGHPSPIDSGMQAKFASLNLGGKRAVSRQDTVAAERLSADGWKLWQQQKLAESEKVFMQAVDKDPGNANAWNGLGWSRFNQGMALNAREAFERCLQEDPKQAACLNGMGWIAKGEGRNEDAIAWWEKAVAASPLATASLSGLAQTYTELQQYNMAAKYFQMWLKAEPTSGPARKGLEEAKSKGGMAVEPETDSFTPKQPLVLEPSPWSDGELMQLALKTPAGMEVGTVFWEASRIKVHGKDAWQVRSRMAVTVNNTFQHTSVQAYEDGFAPYRGSTQNQLGRFLATYRDGVATLQADTGGAKQTQEIEVGEPVFDNEQALYLIRRLPLAPGYSTVFRIFAIQSGSVLECHIDVEGKEVVTGPLGDIECYRIKLAVFQGAMKAFEHTLWIAAEPPRAVVRYDAGQMLMELASYSKMRRGGYVSHRDPDLGIQLSLPPGWLVYPSPNPGSYKAQIQLLDSQLKTWASFQIAERTADAKDADTVARGDVNVLKGYFDAYTVREGSWTKLPRTDFDGVTFLADYTSAGKDMVEYRTYLLDDSAVYWFVFRVEKQNFEKHREQYDTIASKFHVPKGAGDGHVRPPTS